ncbi:hypothetical protein [Noviherbaspirillum denitrificans]|uniref:Uncharacterized protein n=1 Tax=Noviherbaspirillum denitrificans TaxID=1968433 RepID=A0A254TDL1_9BURK|nr:hypothetical protein [Noviherbaspirillum denitrificans]OWW18428.1 hypothetical protein AYR66_01105 [Noviherbaspirillum denitrificans]OWW19392.1 hypothetical protein AYR66_07590 [Noviherbaspirillum denitrificans]
MGNQKPQYRNTFRRIRPVTVRAMLSLAIKPAANRIRRWLINFELQHNEYQLGHIQENRLNDFLVEGELHKRQVHLKSELRRLEA